MGALASACVAAATVLMLACTPFDAQSEADGGPAPPPGSGPSSPVPPSGGPAIVPASCAAPCTPDLVVCEDFEQPEPKGWRRTHDDGARLKIEAGGDGPGCGRHLYAEVGTTIGKPPLSRMLETTVPGMAPGDTVEIDLDLTVEPSRGSESSCSSGIVAFSAGPFDPAGQWIGLGVLGNDVAFIVRVGGGSDRSTPITLEPGAHVRWTIRAPGQTGDAEMSITVKERQVVSTSAPFFAGGSALDIRLSLGVGSATGCGMIKASIDNVRMKISR